MDGNSLKGYGKASTPLGDLFRVETLTPHPEVFKTYRPAEGGAEDDLKWRIMRRGVADMHRRCEVSQKANERDGDALSTVDDSTRFSEFTRTLEQPCQYQGRRVRALHLFQTDDHQLLQAVNRGEFTLNGFRNRDLQLLLYGPVDPNSPLSPKQKRRRSAAVSRKTENPPRSRLDPEGPQNPSLSCHFTRPTSDHRHPHHGPNQYCAQQG